MRVRYTETSLAEIEEIFTYIAAHNPAAATGVTAQVEQTVALISKFPGLGRVKYQQTVRMLPVRRYPRYLVFYTVHHNEVVILNVRHGARRPPWESKKD
jgi:plasmid stabilization system protein ParE